MCLEKDKIIVQDLAKRIKELSELEEQAENKDNWKSLNKLKSKKVMLYVWENELPWSELTMYDEMKVCSQNPFFREQEFMLRKKLFMWNNFRGDMVLEDSITFLPIYRDTMFGIEEKGDIVKYNDELFYRRYTNQINNCEDILQITSPKIIFNTKENSEYEEQLNDLYQGILNVRMGITRHNFSAWHFIVKWLGMEKFYELLYTDINLLHALIRKVREGYFARIKQFQDNNMIITNNGNYTCGSAGLSFVEDAWDDSVINTWGSATSQVFHNISPALQKELAVNYEMEWLKLFRYSCYGCCEDLSGKIDILREIKNLRKISISPWADVNKAIECIGKEYIVSLKINPAIFVLPVWDINEQRLNLRRILNYIKDSHVEIIIKDNSSLIEKKERLTQWLNMAKEEIESL